MQGQLVDNNTYNIIQALASNLEAIEAYRKYANDGNRQLWEQASQHVQQVVQLLLRELPNVAQNAQGTSAGATASSSNYGQQSGSGQGNYGQQTGSGQSNYGQSSTGQSSFGQQSGSSQSNRQ